MAKIDYKREMASLYNPPAKVAAVVDVPAMNFLMLDGAGDPNGSPTYQAAVEALYAVAYTLKFMVKKGPTGVDYGVMPLEGQWWVDNLADFSYNDRSNWHWTMMIMQPDVVTTELVDATRQEVTKKKGLDLAGLRFEALDEERAAQIMHLGPYADELATVDCLHRFIVAQGLQPRGKHHEIYLSDPNRTAPEKLKTVLRQPVV